MGPGSEYVWHAHRNGDGWNGRGGQDLAGHRRRSQRFGGGVGVGAPKAGSADFGRRLQLYTFITHTHHLLVYIYLVLHIYIYAVYVYLYI